MLQIQVLLLLMLLGWVAVEVKVMLLLLLDLCQWVQGAAAKVMEVCPPPQQGVQQLLMDSQMWCQRC
jgi:hypothetical protein